MGERAQEAYWKALRESDQIIAASPMGILPEPMHREINRKISPIIDEILYQSRALVVSYQRSVDREMTLNAKAEADRDRRNLTFFFIFLVTGSLFLLLNARTNFKNYRIAREKIEEEQDRLDQTLSELRQAEDTVNELRDLNDAKNAFISTVNHELRTPLTSIIGYIDVVREIRETDPTADLTHYLDTLNRNAEILLHVVESILSISKIDASKGLQVREKVLINQVIDNSIFIMTPSIHTNQQSISFYAEEELFVEGDPAQLSQVMINLIGNAHKFSPNNSKIDITLDSLTLHRGLEFARIVIRDRGIGIPAEDIENLTTRFFRAKNTESGQYSGTGLGLSIVKQILTLHGGTISIASTLGEGTTITLLIPLYLSNDEELIRARSGDVLARAITSLEDATPATAKAVTHTIGGAIALYGFEDIGRELLNFSRSLGTEQPSEESFLIERAKLLHLLKKVASELEVEGDE
jgi:signal transduction histidine kinase